MRHSICLLLGLLCSLSCFSQKLEEFQVDDKIKVRLPKGTQAKDTLLQKLVTSASDNTSFVITVTPSFAEIQLTGPEMLDQMYKTILDQRIAQDGGTYISDSTIQKGLLKLKKYKYSMVEEGQKYIAEGQMLFLEKNIYTFNTIQEDGEDTPDKQKDREFFFRSIRISPEFMTFKQYEQGKPGKTESGYDRGYRFGQGLVKLILSGVILLGGGLFLLFRYLRKKKQEQK